MRHGLAQCLACASRCVYCRLPVRIAGAGDHPGHVVVDQVSGVNGLSGLIMLHRFCRGSAHSRSAARRGLVARRAYLGRATECYEARLPVRPYDRLGVCPGDGQRWRIAKMRYACKACRYYTSSH